jgi:hypothetical protein
MGMMDIFGGVLDSFTGGLGGAALNMATNAIGGAQSAGQARAANKFSAAQAALDRNFSHGEAQNQMNFQNSQAQGARDWEANMANTSYQRAVGDLGRAGLNPMLSVMHGGAATPNSPSPQGAMGHSSAPRGAMGQTFTSQNNALNSKQIEVANSQIGLNNAQAAKSNAEAASLPGYRKSLGGLADAQTGTQGETAKKIGDERKEIAQKIIESQSRVLSNAVGWRKTEGEILLNKAKAILAGQEGTLAEARAALAQMDTLLAPAAAEHQSATAELTRAHTTEAQAESDYYTQWPYAKAAEKAINLGSSFFSNAQSAATTRAAIKYGNRADRLNRGRKR